MPAWPSSYQTMPILCANSRITLPCSAVAISRGGMKCDGTKTTRDLSNTSFTPNFLNWRMVIGAVMSFAITKSTFALIRSPGETSFLPHLAARIFSASVIPIVLPLLCSATVFVGPLPYRIADPQHLLSSLNQLCHT